MTDVLFFIVWLCGMIMGTVLGIIIGNRLADWWWDDET